MRMVHTVEVISAEQISQIYFIPPSVGRTAVFFFISPIVIRGLRHSRSMSFHRT